MTVIATCVTPNSLAPGSRPGAANNYDTSSHSKNTIGANDNANAHNDDNNNNNDNDNHHHHHHTKKNDIDDK